MNRLNALIDYWWHIAESAQSWTPMKDCVRAPDRKVFELAVDKVNGYLAIRNAIRGLQEVD